MGKRRPSLFRKEQVQRRGESQKAYWARLRRMEEARARESAATYNPALREEERVDELTAGFRQALERDV